MRHAHPFLQGIYLNFSGFSTFSSEPADRLDVFFSLISSSQWHSMFGEVFLVFLDGFIEIPAFGLALQLL